MLYEEHNDKDVQIMIEDCLNNEGDLTEWEFDFVYNISHLSKITVKQYRKLVNIWEKIMKEEITE